MEDKKFYMLEDDKLVEVSGGDVETYQHLEVLFRCREDGVEKCETLCVYFGSKFIGDNDEHAEESARELCEDLGLEFIEYLGCKVVHGGC